MALHSKKETNVGDRLDRLPFSRFHLKFLLLIAGGEFFALFMIFGQGSLAVLVEHALGLSAVVGTLIIPTSFYLGMLIGTLALGRLADTKGRRFIYFVNLGIVAIASLLAAIMPNYILVSIFMFIIGIGVGPELGIADTYVSEVMPKNSRGARLALVYTIAVIGAPVAALVMYGLSGFNLDLSWRLTLIIVAIGSAIMWILRRKIVESPRWLEGVGKKKQAEEETEEIEKRVMKYNHLRKLPPITKTTPVVPNKRVGWGALFSKKLRLRTLMIIIFQYAQSGAAFTFNVLVPLFFVDKGYTITSSILFSMVIFSGFVIGSIFNIPIIDRIERKFGIVMFIFIAGILGLLFAVTSNLYLMLALGFFIQFSFWNMSNFFHQYQAEIFPTKLRGSATGLGQSINALASATVPLFMVALVISHGLLVTFIGIFILIAIVIADILLIGPKSSKMHLEEISNM
ncbi:MAG: MFS transporter [Candidatus Marsarchaeota archaeon]|nr:MFS transporter [Candidatus Marsarchaeota archaeon]MCL5102235.1 MFS transporter [Candidatus Marsarchaeota archaeon]